MVIAAPPGRTGIGRRVGGWAIAAFVSFALYGAYLPLAGFEMFRPYVDQAEVWSLVALALGVLSAYLGWSVRHRVGPGVRRLMTVGSLFALLGSGAYVHYVHVLTSQLPEPAPLHVGDEAPLFSAPDFLGQTVQLDRWRGKPVVLVFYRGHW